ANANSLPAATALTVGQNAILNLNGANTIGSLSGDSLNPGSIQLNGFALTVGDQTSTSFYGAIVGGGSAPLIKQGAGALTLNGDLSGASITVNLGTLRLGSPNASLAGAVNVAGAGPAFGTLAL